MKKTLSIIIIIILLTGTSPQAHADSGFLVATEDYNPVDEWNVFPKTNDKFTTVDETTCTSTDGIYVKGGDEGKQQAFVIDVSGVPIGSEITSIIVRPCMSANDNDTGSSTVGVRVRLDDSPITFESDYSYYTVGGAINGNTPTVLYDSYFFIGTSTPFIMGTTTELVVGFEYFSGHGARVSHFETQLLY